MASVLGFLGSFGREKARDAQQSFLQKLVAWDPATASKAEIEEMIKELDKVTIEAGKARVDYEKEVAEATAARKNYDKHLAAAELLQKRVADGEQGLEASLETLVDTLEKMRPDVEREEQEATEAKEYFDEVKEMASITADKLKSAKAMLEDAQRDMKRAEIEAQRSKARAEKAEALAGLRKDTSSLGVALESMRNQAKEVRAKAEASNMKSDLLTEVKKDDQNIADALKAVSGENTSKASAADRLAALKK